MARYQLLKGCYRMLGGTTVRKGAIIHSELDLAARFQNKFLAMDAPVKAEEAFTKDQVIEVQHETKSKGLKKRKGSGSPSALAVATEFGHEEEEIDLGEDVTADYIDAGAGIKVYKVDKKYNLYLEGDNQPINKEPLTLKGMKTQLKELNVLDEE